MTAAVKESDVRMKETTFFWHLEEEGERDIAALYVEKMYPGTEAMVVSEFIIPQLTVLNHVIVLSRDRKRFPLETTSRNPETGERISNPVALENVLHSVRESPVLAVAPFITGASKRSMGTLNENAFFDEVGKYISGALRVQGAERKIRYILG